MISTHTHTQTHTHARSLQVQPVALQPVTDVSEPKAKKHPVDQTFSLSSG